MSSPEILGLAERVSIGQDAGESHFREFKSALSQQGGGSSHPRDAKAICRDISDALVSFANADGGELFVGMEDDGSVTGVPHKEALVAMMKNSFIQYVHADTPLPPPVIGDLTIDGRRIVYFSISKSVGQIHQTSEGRCLRRVDRENIPVAFENIQADRIENVSREYDRVFLDGATTADLDLELVNSVAEIIVPGRSPEKFLQFLGLAEYGNTGLRYRRAALLLFAKDVTRWHPRCAVRVLRVNGTELGVGEKYNVSQDDQISGTVLKLLEDVWEAIRPYLARTHLQSSGLFRERLIYPEAACRESLVNAIAHRDYSREGNLIEIFVYDDRMVFASPGGLLSAISLDRLKSLERVHESRNVLIAKVLREIGHMREIGEGIPRIFSAMRDSELVDPTLRNELDRFTVTLQHQSIFTHQDIEWLDGYREFDLNKNEQRVVLLGRDGHLLSTNEIIQVAGIVDIDNFRDLHERLLRKGVLYSAKQRHGATGQRRDHGRFQIRPSREMEQFFGELLQALREVAPATTFSADSSRAVRSRLHSGSPYYRNVDQSLQVLGFIDTQKRYLPKAFSYVPELESSTVRQTPSHIEGVIKAIKTAGYGFIGGVNGIDYFFHKSGLPQDVEWQSIELGLSVSFRVKPGRASGERDNAFDVRPS
jgi:ATP-dependent DNA helicase RecG